MVYFSVRKFARYGQLSNRTLDSNLSGERITVADDKQAPEDFELWKRAEKGHLMKWKSPWGEGYPGWHIECSTLSRKFIGKTLDIHGGGIDNIFPHHECECAQSEVANGQRFVNYFIHNNLITINGTKMGKSLGNFITLDELFSEFDPMWVRYYILQFSYRSPVDFTKNAIAAAGEQFEKIKEGYKKLFSLAGQNSKKPTLSEPRGYLSEIEKAMDEDFNTPLVISTLLQMAKRAQQLGAGDAQLAAEILGVFDEVSFILGLDFKSVETIKKDDGKEEILENIISSVRQKLREEKNYALSDFIRDELTKNGITVKDKKI